MGLDMYLTAERYLSDFQEEDKELKDTISEAAGVPVREIVCEAAYWRKANAIHKWFVDNVQEGRDECQKSYVSRDQLTALRDVCEEVLEDPEKAPRLLPSSTGFFFGSGEYDDWYFKDLKNTCEVLDELAAKFPKEQYSIYYQASW